MFDLLALAAPTANASALYYDIAIGAGAVAIIGALAKWVWPSVIRIFKLHRAFWRWWGGRQKIDGIEDAIVPAPKRLVDLETAVRAVHTDVTSLTENTNEFHKTQIAINTQLAESIAAVKDQVTPNGGTAKTLGDIAVRLEHAVATLVINVQQSREETAAASVKSDKQATAADEVAVSQRAEAVTVAAEADRVAVETAQYNVEHQHDK